MGSHPCVKAGWLAEELSTAAALQLLCCCRSGGFACSQVRGSEAERVCVCCMRGINVCKDMPTWHCSSLAFKMLLEMRNRVKAGGKGARALLSRFKAFPPHILYRSVQSSSDAEADSWPKRSPGAAGLPGGLVGDK